MTINTTTTPTLTPIAEAAANDPALQKVLDGVKSGTIHATAPCDAVYNTWPEAEREKLVRKMAELFGKK